MTPSPSRRSFAWNLLPSLVLMSVLTATARSEVELTGEEYDELTAAVRYSGTYGRSAAAKSTICLGTVESEKEPTGILTRELVRQALLIAARDGLGLATRDRTLREDFGNASTDGAPINIAVIHGPGDKLRIFAFRQSERTVQPLIREEIAWKDADGFPVLVRVIEGISRGPLVAALKEAEHEGKENAVGDGTVPEKAAEFLDRLDAVSQIAALRILHAEIARTGESPARLAALARGYAQLGTIVETCHYLGHLAFKARSLLYAERAVVRSEGAPAELWSRALVRALIGFHADALKDVEAARAHAAVKAGYVEPKWGGAIEAMCRFDVQKLDPFAQAAETRPLAVYLKVLMSEYTSNKRTIGLAASDCLDVHPDCARALLATVRLRDLDVARAVVTHGPVMFRRWFYRRLSDVPGVPDELAKLARERVEEGEEAGEDVELRVQMIDGLNKGGTAAEDRREPSLAILARIVKEASFREVYNELSYLDGWLSVPVAERRTVLLPLIDGHPLAPFLAAVDEDKQKIRPRAKQIWGGLQPQEADGMDYSFQGYVPLENPFLTDWNNRIRRHLDFPGGAVEATLSSYYADDRKRAERLIFQWTPHAPIAVAARIREDWKSIEADADGLEKRYADVTAVLTALAQQHLAAKRYDDAARCFRRCLEISPQVDMYRALAEVYRQQEKFDEWKATLEEALALPQRGLTHAQIRVQIARHFMGRKEFETALPYANAAADTYAAWAMYCAAECEEGLDHWAESEMWTRRVSERYRDQTTSWFFWCHRTGRGDEAAARKFTEEYFGSLETPAPNADIRRIGMFYLMTKQNAEALEVFQEDMKRLADPFVGLQIALLADEMKKPEIRDAALQTTAEKGGASLVNDQPRKLLMRVAEEYRALLARRAVNPKAAFNRRPIDAERQRAPAGENTFADYFLGRIYARLGDEEQSRKYLQLAATSPYFDRMSVAHAASLLRGQKLTVDARRDKELVGIEPRKFDVAAERRVAGWVLEKKGNVEVTLENGERRSMSAPPLPDGSFSVASIYLPEPKEGLDDAALKNLAGLSELESLSLRPGYTGEGLKSIAGLASLKRLTVGGPTFNDDGMAVVGTFANLEELIAQGSEGRGQVTDKGMAALAKLTQLRRLFLAEQEFTDAGLSHLAGLTSLQDLVLSNHRRNIPNVTDAGMAHLHELTELRTLQLCSSSVTDEGLKHLAGMHELATVNLSINRINGTGLKHLTGKQLRTLDVSWGGVTDAGLKEITRFTGLITLKAARSSPADATVLELAKLKSLAGLDLTQTSLRKATVEALKMELPKCQVVVSAEQLKP